MQLFRSIPSICFISLQLNASLRVLVLKKVFSSPQISGLTA